MGWPDVSFPRDYCLSGFDILGEVPDFGIWRLEDPEVQALERSTRLRVPDLLASNITWRSTLTASLRRKGRSATAAAEAGDPVPMRDIHLVHSTTLAQQSAGLVEICSISQLNKRFGDGRWRVDERFIVHKATRDRACENCRASRKNETFFTAEKVGFAPADSAAATGRYLYLASRDDLWDFPWGMGASSDDEPDAYKSSAARQP
jgi:hypothetical protein